MRVFVDFICVKCEHKETFYINHEQISSFQETEVCSKCGGRIRKSWEFGGAILKGSGYTKNFIK